jgi:hypothetical protein
MCRTYSKRGIFRYIDTSFHLVEPLLPVGGDPLVSGLNRRLILNGLWANMMGLCVDVVWFRRGKCGKFVEYSNTGNP